MLWYGMYIMYFCIWWQVRCPGGLLKLVWISWLHNGWLIDWKSSKTFHEFHCSSMSQLISHFLNISEVIHAFLLAQYRTRKGSTHSIFATNQQLPFISSWHILIYIHIQQDATLHSFYFWKLLYMFRVVPPPIIRSTYNCIYSIWYLSNRNCYLPLLW